MDAPATISVVSGEGLTADRMFVIEPSAITNGALRMEDGHLVIDAAKVSVEHDGRRVPLAELLPTAVG